MCYKIVRLVDKPELKERAAAWFHGKWGVPLEEYMKSMDDCLTGKNAVPQWYMAMDRLRIVGGMGVIENDFHVRKDLTPNICAVYTEEDRRGMGIAGALFHYVCTDMKSRCINTLYLVTELEAFYERYGWEFLCMVRGNSESDIMRMYIHRA